MTHDTQHMTMIFFWLLKYWDCFGIGAIICTCREVQYLPYKTNSTYSKKKTYVLSAQQILEEISVRRHLGSYKGRKNKIHTDSLQTDSLCVSWFKFYRTMTALTFTKLAYLKRQYSRKSTEKTCFIVTSYIRIVFGAIVH